MWLLPALDCFCGTVEKTGSSYILSRHSMGSDTTLARSLPHSAGDDDNQHFHS